jgi:hypothetical protein
MNNNQIDKLVEYSYAHYYNLKNSAHLTILENVANWNASLDGDARRENVMRMIKVNAVVGESWIAKRLNKSGKLSVVPSGVMKGVDLKCQKTGANIECKFRSTALPAQTDNFFFELKSTNGKSTHLGTNRCHWVAWTFKCGNVLVIDWIKLHALFNDGALSGASLQRSKYGTQGINVSYSTLNANNLCKLIQVES